MSEDRTRRRQDGSALRGWLLSLAAGLSLALAALVVTPIAGLPIRWAADAEAGEIAAGTLFAGVFIAGSVTWWLLVARRDQGGVRQGSVAGVYAAGFSYPAVLFLAEFVQDWQAQAATANLLERLAQVLAVSVFALLTTGFVATVTLGFVGMLIGAAQGPLTGAPASTTPSAQPAPVHGVYRIAGYVALCLFVVLAALFAGLSLFPIRPLTMPVAAAPLPSSGYEAALTAFGAVQREEAALDLHPRCGTQLLTHGRKVERAVIFFHGLTNCPAQADELAPMLFAQGYNVLVPRLPGHGDADPLTLALADMRAEDLAENGQRSVALAQGLGVEVMVIGLSAGGTMTAHLTQQQGDVTGAISVAPFLAPRLVPPWAAHAATNLLLWLPNMMVWWDPRSPYSAPEMDYAYPRFATHALGEIMRLGQIVSSASNVTPPAAPHIGVLINEADLAISNILVRQLVEAWQEHGHAVDLRVLPVAERLPHDLIDPRQPDADTGLVYPLLIDMLSPAAPD
jgi:esterase/lipase